MRIRLLVNPTAGRGRAGRLIDRALAYLSSRGCSIEFKSSNSAEQLTELAADPSNADFDRLVICGGDGSLNLALRRLDLARITLGIVPLGSGDDFAKTLLIPAEPEAACKVILGGVTRRVDVGEANGIRFLGVAGVGFDSLVARWVNEHKTFLRGSLLYLYGIFRVLPSFLPLPITYAVDGERRRQDLMFAVVGNSHRYGGGIAIAPGARIDDRKLNAYFIGRCSRLDLLTTLPLAYSGRHVKRPFVSAAVGSRFEIDSEEPLDVFADGELLTRTPVVITLAPETLKVCVP